MKIEIISDCAELCKSLIINCLQRLFPDAVIPENPLQHILGVDQVLAEDLVEGGDGTAEVFGDEIGGSAGGEGLAGVGKGIGSPVKRFVVTDIGNKSRIRVGDQVRFQLGQG